MLLFHNDTELWELGLFYVGECAGVSANTQNYLMGYYRVCYEDKPKPLDEEMGSLNTEG